MSDTIAEVTVPKQRPKKPETRTPRVAVIGCGYWGRNLVRNFANLGALAAICDHDYALASTLGEEHGAPVAAFSDITASADIDAVVIAAPAERHFIIAEEALIAGKHVFVEKPLALDIEQAEALCDLAEQNDRVLMVGHLLQYHPAFVRLKEIVLGGELGRIQYLYSNRLNLGKIRREENILWSFAPHDISMILALVGEEPDTVSATGAKFLHKYIADVTTTHLSFPSGPHAHVFVSWLHPVKEQRLVVVGDRQMAVFDDGQDWPAKLTLYPDRVNWRNGQPEPVKGDAIAVPLEKAEPLALECGHFLDCLREHKKPRTDGREGLRVLRVLQMAEHSMNSRCAQVSTVRPVEDFTPAPAPAPMPVPARAAERKRPEPAAKSAPEGVVIHESAYVDTPCSIGKGTKIWHFGHVLKGTRIGRDCVLGQNVMVGPDVTVGDNCKIQNNVSLYKGVVLEDDVFCGPSCVFTNVYNPRASVERKEEFRDTRVGRGATIGANATIVCGNAVGAYSLVAAGAVVTHDVPPHAIVAGVPARRIGWVSHDGEILGDDLKCPRSGRRYRLEDENTLVEMRDE